jgi:excisionase family DNA binding protein|nr:MAG TPA: helix-turn-helix domain protein [Caudoviricetes sp.]
MTNLALVSLDDLRVLLAESSIKNETWNVDQAAEYFEVSPQTIRKEAEMGILPARKVGREWKFSSIALYQYVSKNEEAR